MSLHDLRKRLDSVTLAQHEKQEHDIEQLEVEMAALAARRLEFSNRAPELFDTVVEPRLQLLAEHLPDSLFQRSSNDKYSGVVTLNRHRRYAAMIEVEASATSDDQVENIVVSYELRIIPVLMEFERKDTLVVPLSNVDGIAVAEFLDMKIEGAVRSYVKLTNNPYYQREHLVIDPVCGMTIHEDEAAEVVEYEGRRFFFCAQVCREHFERSPSEFI